MMGLALLAVVPGLILLVIGLTERPGTEEIVAIASGIGSTTFPIAALILAAATLREERDEGTLPYIYLKPISRFTMAATSILAAICATSVLALAASGSVAAAAGLTGLDIGEAVATIPLYLAAAIGYSAVFVPTGYLMPRIVLVGLGYVIVWEQIVARLVTGVANTSIWRFALSIYADMSTADFALFAEALGPVAPGKWGGIVKLAGVVIVGGAVLTWALRRRDAL